MSEAQMIRLHDFPGRGMGEQIRVALSFFGAECVPVLHQIRASFFPVKILVAYPCSECCPLNVKKLAIGDIVNVGELSPSLCPK
jgi:hypothetical protein